MCRRGDPPYTFVTEGIERAVEQARTAAGEKNVTLMGATIVQQCLRAGLLDELTINLVPIVLGRGVRLLDGLENGSVEFDLVQVVDAPGVTHLTYRTMAQTPGAASCDRPPAVEGVQRTRARYGRRRVLCGFHESGRCCALRLQDQQCRPQPGGVEIRDGLHTGEAELFGASSRPGSTGSRGASGARRRIW